MMNATTKSDIVNLDKVLTLLSSAYTSNDPTHRDVDDAIQAAKELVAAKITELRDAPEVVAPAEDKSGYGVSASNRILTVKVGGDCRTLSEVKKLARQFISSADWQPGWRTQTRAARLWVSDLSTKEIRAEGSVSYDY